MMTPTKSAAILALAVMAAGVDAHGKMTLPEPTCSAGYCSNSPSGTIDGPSTIPVPAGMSYGTDPQSNTDAFLKAFKTSKYKTLKDLVTSSAVKLEAGASLECGYSSVNGKAQPLPDQVQWDKFDLSHMGPCEVWCDNTRVFQDDQCSVNFKSQPAKLPYDKSKCAGAKMLTSFWIALHVPTWQVYTNCAPISGSGASSGGSTPAATSKAPAATSKAPTATSKAPAATSKAPTATSPPASGGDEYDDEYTTPKPSNNNSGGSNSSKPSTTPKPAATPKTPAATKKCKAKTRRN